MTPPSDRMPSTGGCPLSTPRSPSSVLAMTMRASPDHTSPSGTTSSTRSVTGASRFLCWPGRSLALQLRGLRLHVLDAAAHEEGLLGIIVVLALGERLERGDRVAQRHEHA